MEAALFAKMLSDPAITNLRKLQYKYPNADLSEFLSLLNDSFYVPLGLSDFKGDSLIYMKSLASIHPGAVKALLAPQSSSPFGLKAMEEEITASLTIENVDFARDSVRKILQGSAPANESEDRIFGMKRGLEFISDLDHKITEDNLFHLYQMAIGNFLEEENKLLPGQYYRHDAVYVMGQTVAHTGLPHQKLPAYMEGLISFIQAEDGMDDLLKAAVIHFYLAYLHPYFDGNGRMARLLHLWYLVQRGYSSALFIPISSHIEQSRRQYYNAYTQIDENAKISSLLDVTPFLVYFTEYIYPHLTEATAPAKSAREFTSVLASGSITEKEQALWAFVLSAYGMEEFSTKQLERDFGAAAYATIRKFVLKFEALGLLTSRHLSNRVKYRVSPQ